MNGELLRERDRVELMCLAERTREGNHNQGTGGPDNPYGQVLTANPGEGW